MKRPASVEKGVPDANVIKELLMGMQTLQKQMDMLVHNPIVKTEETGTPRVKMEPGFHTRTFPEGNNDTGCIDLVSDDDAADGEHEHAHEPAPGVLHNPPRAPKKSMYTKPHPNMTASLAGLTSADPSPKRARTKASAQKRQKKAYSKTKHLRNGAFRNWCNGHQRNCQAKKIREEILDATVDNPEELAPMMRVNGFAVLRNYDKVLRRVKIEATDSDFDDLTSTRAEWGSLFSTGNAPTEHQAAYHENGTFDGKKGKKPPADLVFEGCVINEKTYEFGINNSPNEVCTVTGKVPRMLMKSKTKAHAAYNKQYMGQMEDIIKGMFPQEDGDTCLSGAADPANWNMTQSIVWGGIDHQHPHCDQGKAGSYQYEQIFPFVCIHGFGLHEFTMWLLPLKKKREYGFPYRFPKKAMLFMRGDFIHAGACSQQTRSHLEFYPKAAAGWTKTLHPYWATPEDFSAWQEKKDTFLIPDLRSFPFGFPKISEDDVNGDQTVTYPCRATRELYPNIDDNPPPSNTTKRKLPPPPATAMERQRKKKRK